MVLLKKYIFVFKKIENFKKSLKKLKFLKKVKKNCKFLKKF